MRTRAFFVRTIGKTGRRRLVSALWIASLLSLFPLHATARAALRFGVIWYSTAPDARTYDLAAQRYEVGVTGLVSGKDRQEIVQRRPTFQWFVYDSATDNYVPPHKGDTEGHATLEALALGRNWSVEDAYLHYVDDTVIVLRGDTVRVPGWGMLEAGDPESSRLPVYNADLTRRANHFGSPRSRQLHKEVMIKMLLDRPFPETSIYASGLFLDNASGHLFNTGKVLSGGHVREAPNQAEVASPEFRAWYLDSFIEFLSDLKDTLQTADAWSRDGKSKKLMINVANVWHDEYVERDAADFLLLEFQYNPIRNVGAEAVMESYRRDAFAANRGIVSFYSAGMTRSVNGHPETYSTEEVMLGNLAWYLISRSAKTLFFQQGTNAPATAGWDSLTWNGAMDVARNQLGEAVSPPYVIARGVDPLGQAYTVHARHYQSGLVLLRNRGSWKERIGADTAVTVSLPSPLARVGPSGAVSMVVQEVGLRNGEGMLFLGDPGDPRPVEKQ